MTTYATQGWDIVGAIDQKTLNVELGVLYNRGGLPNHLEAVSTRYFSASLSADIGPPTATLGGVTQGIAQLTFKITKGTLKFGKKPDTELEGIVFTVSTAVNQIELQTRDTVKIYIDFLSDAMAITISGLPDRDLQDILNFMLRKAFEQLKAGSYYLATVDIVALDIPDFLWPRKVAFTLVPHPNLPELNELLVLLQTVGRSGQKNYNDTLLPDGREGVVLLSNERLLTNVVGDGLKEAIPTGHFDYSPNDFHLTATTKYGDDDLKGAHASVEGNAIHVRLNVAAMGKLGGGVNIYVDSDTKITVTYDSGSASFQVTQDTPKPHTSYTLEWWVYMVAAVTGGAIGIAIAVVIGEVTRLVSVGISEKEIKKAFEGALKPIKWPAGGYVTPTAVNFPEPLQMFVAPKT